jgi:hypothetical protein
MIYCKNRPTAVVYRTQKEFCADSSASKCYIIVCTVDQYFAASLPSQASRCSIKPVKGRQDVFQWNKTDTYDVLVINPSNAFLREKNHVPNYTQVTEQNCTEGMPWYY